MKTYPFDLTTAFGLARLVTITRGTEIIRFTDAPADVVVGGLSYKAEPGVQITAMSFATDGTVSSVQVVLAARTGGPLSDADVAIGRYDGVPITIDCIDRGNIAAGAGSLFVGYIGTVDTNVPAVIRIEARGPLIRLRADVSERYSQMCRADLGDDRCRVPILPDDIQRNHAYVIGDEVASFVRVRVNSNGDPSDYVNRYYEVTTAGTTAGSQPAYNTGVGSTTTDGTAVLTAREAWLRYARVGSIVSAQSFTLQSSPDSRAVNDWFTLGGVILREGSYNGNMFTVRRWTQSSLLIDTWDTVSHMLTAGMWIELYRGCQKTAADCLVFNNVRNRRAEPFTPGSDALYSLAT